MYDAFLLIFKDIAMTIGSMAVGVLFFSFLAYTYVNMLR